MARVTPHEPFFILERGKMQLQRRIAMRVIEQGLDPKKPCILDKRGNIRQKTKKELPVAVLKDENVIGVIETTVTEEILQTTVELQETIETPEVVEETSAIAQEATSATSKSIKNKFTKKK